MRQPVFFERKKKHIRKHTESCIEERQIQITKERHKMRKENDRQRKLYRLKDVKEER